MARTKKIAKPPVIRVYYRGFITLYFTSKKAFLCPVGFKVCDTQSKNKLHKGMVRITPIRPKKPVINCIGVYCDKNN